LPQMPTPALMAKLKPRAVAIIGEYLTPDLLDAFATAENVVISTGQKRSIGATEFVGASADAWAPENRKSSQESSPKKAKTSTLTPGQKQLEKVNKKGMNYLQKLKSLYKKVFLYLALVNLTK